jgi:hypothetical protein
MTDIDIPLSEELQKAFQIPPCSEIALPFPKPLKVTLPTGSTMNAFVDMSKGIPNDCSMNFNLMVQMAPLLAAMECPLKVLKLLKPLVDIIEGLVKVPPAPPAWAVTEFIDAAVELAPCFTVFAAIPAFIIDLLRLILSVLNCLLGQIRTVRNLLGGLQLRMGEAEGNPDLLAALQCAQSNAGASMQSLTQAIDPISGLLELVGLIASLGGQSLNLSLSAPSAPPQDLAAIDALIDVLQAAVDAISAVPGVAGG